MRRSARDTGIRLPFTSMGNRGIRRSGYTKEPRHPRDNLTRASKKERRPMNLFNSKNQSDKQVQPAPLGKSRYVWLIRVYSSGLLIYAGRAEHDDLHHSQSGYVEFHDLETGCPVFAFGHYVIELVLRDSPAPERPATAGNSILSA